MKNNQPLLLIIVLILQYNLAAQDFEIPKEIKETHQRLSDHYEGVKEDRIHFTEDFVKKETAFLQKFYDSITEYYRYFDAKKKILKGVRVYTDNDAFAFGNRDHEYTGGLRIEFITDYVGLKLLSLRKDNDYLTYQAVFFGFELYTPDNIDIKDPIDLDPRDRPFASFQYIGRSRNSIRLDGKYRVSGELKIGIIGGEVSRNFQRIIHRDITDSSNNNGWDYQIANEGRFAIQYNSSNEWQEKLTDNGQYVSYGVNFGLGFEKTFVSPILSISNKTFFERNHHNAINSSNKYFGTQSLWTQIKQTLFYEATVAPEYVIYNSMLQGYPTKNKEFVARNNGKVVIPVIDNISNIVTKFSLSFGFRNYNSTLMFSYYIQTPEYDYGWKDKAFHKYGRISFTLNI